MKLKPTHRKALAALLDQDHDTPEAAVDALYEKLLELQSERYHAIVYQINMGDAGYGFSVVGPYSTERQAQKAQEQSVGALPGTEGRLATILTPAAILLHQREQEEKDREAVSQACEECKHPRFGHWPTQWWKMGTSRARHKPQPAGCTVEGCVCRSVYPKAQWDGKKKR